jgi:L-iditol 2-dehydrogenase
VRALVCEGPGEPVLRNVPAPDPGPGEVLVRVRAVLTCGTDLKIARRGHPKFPFPLTLGHEWAGVVERTGPGAAWAPGARVTSAVSAPCGACGACREGRENLCATAFDRPLFGAFADLLLVPARIAKGGLRRIPDGMPDETAALLDPLASVVRGLARARSARSGDDRGDEVLIAGTGPIAALLFFLLRGKEKEEKERTASGTERRIVVAGRRPERLVFFERNMARVARIGSTARAGDAEASAARFTFKENPPLPSRIENGHEEGARSFSLVIDTTGDPDVIAALPALAADGGTVLLFAGLPSGARVAMDAHSVHYREVSIVGSFHYTPADVDEALALLASGAIPVAEIVSARRSLAEWKSAFDLAREGTALKVAVVP